MDDTLPERLQRILARVAERTSREVSEANSSLDRCRGLADGALRALAADTSAPSIERRNALVVLATRLRADRALTEIVLPLFDDPDADLAIEAIRCAPAFDPRATGRLRTLLDRPGDDCWAHAATALARRKDPAMLPIALGWFRDGDTPHRNTAFACLEFLLPPDDWRDLLESAWDDDPRDEDDGVMLACALLRLGDGRGLPFLAELAGEARHPASIPAADMVYDHDPALGLELMTRILDHGPPGLRWGMAERIARRSEDSHLWTADAIHEARAWVQRARLG